MSRSRQPLSLSAGVALALLVLNCLTPPARAVVSRAEHLRYCIICHINWGDDFEKLEPLMPPLKHPVLLDGEPAYNSDERMCWSCHDAYVADSRAKFDVHDDPHLKRLPAGFSAGRLPLDLNGQVYCGTCHTPHTHKMGRKYEFKPFIREGILASQLCLNCHADHAGGTANHPLHQQLAAGRGAELANDFTPRDRVECLSCHQMHGARPTRLTEGEDRSRLCASCHTPQQEILATRHNQGTPGGRDACSVCHQPHGTSGQPARGNTVCQRCHDAPLGHAAEGGAWGHPLGGVPESSAGLPLRQGQVVCVSCHDPHRWAADGSPDTGAAGTATTSFLRRPDQAEGGLCLGCHPRQAAILDSDHGAGEPAFAVLTGLETWRCTACHDAHGAGVMRVEPEPPAAEAALSPATRMCLSCHCDAPATGAAVTSVGRFSHPLGVGAGAVQATWLSGEPDQVIGCETCHDPHRWSPAGEVWTPGQDGDEGSSFLRADNRHGELCLDCHEQQAALQGSLHDQRGRPGANANPCAACHSPHRAATELLLSPRVAGADLEHLLPESDWAPESKERQPANWTAGAIGCLACHHSAKEGQRVPGAWVHPTWEAKAPPEIVPERLKNLHIDCRTCHNPHLPWRPGREGSRVQFLTNESSETLCATCHGDEALWRYNYYHDPRRRRP